MKLICNWRNSYKMTPKKSNIQWRFVSNLGLKFRKLNHSEIQEKWKILTKDNKTPASLKNNAIKQ